MRDNQVSDKEIVWQPNPSQIKQTNLYLFMRKYGFSTLEDFQAKSVKDIAWFWDAVIKDMDIEFFTPYESIVDLSQGIEFPVWCKNGKMNITYNCLDKWINQGYGQEVAMVWNGEEGFRIPYTYDRLNKSVCECAAAMRAIGLRKGDVIGIYLPMIPETVISFLAIARIGAIALPLFSGFGPKAISDRLNDAYAKAVFCSDGMWRRGDVIEMKPVLDEALETVPSIEHVIVCRRMMLSDQTWVSQRDISWDDFICTPKDEGHAESTSAEDPLMLIYTSGTTGKPKGTVHTHCGFPIKSASDARYCMDVKSDDKVFWFTDIGWMMGPWNIFSALLNRSRIIIYDGAPDYPKKDKLWELVDQDNITHLGVSPSLIRHLKKFGEKLVQRNDVSSLRMIGSTGSPWDPDSWKWLFQTVLEKQKPILNYTGGTEIGGGILLGNFLTPLKPCAFSGAIPGIDADVVDESGNSVQGEVGELVIRQPWIGMTRGFWNSRQRYLEAYWKTWPGIWHHGDYAVKDHDGLWYLYGRSDDAMNIAGKKIGPAEIESILNGHDLVLESAVISVPCEIKGDTAVGFCVLISKPAKYSALEKELKDLVGHNLAKPLKPSKIHFVKALPKTRNAKIMRRLIRSAYLGHELGDMSSLENPDSLNEIKKLK